MNKKSYFFFLDYQDVPIINWDTLYYPTEDYMVSIFNNTNDTIFIDKSISTRSRPPIIWEIDTKKEYHLPKDTIKVKIAIYRQFRAYQILNKKIIIKYYVNSNKTVRNFEFMTKGTLVDSSLIKRHLEDKRKKELAAKRKNPNYSFYDSGELKSIKQPNPTHDSIPTRVTYYKNGKIRVKEYRGQDIRKKAYDKSGNLKSTWDNQNLRTDYYPNGNIRFKEGQDRYSSTDPFLSYYYKNGCIRKAVFLDETLFKEYDSVECNKLINERIINEKVVTTKYGKITTHYKNGNVIGQTFLSNGLVKNEAKGTYKHESLINGTISYYWNNALLFVSKIHHGIRDTILSNDEKQGDQINLVDASGKKTGLWITDKTTKLPIEISKDITYNCPSFSFFQYEYENGDTIARVTLHDLGGIESYLYVRDKERRIKANKWYFVSYYENGFIKHRSYQLKHGIFVDVKFSKEEKNKAIGGKKGSTGRLVYKNNRLVEIRSKPIDVTPIDEPFENSLSNHHRDPKPYCIEKGEFKNFELHNGFIYYYKADSTLRLTEKVLDGVILNNPKVILKQPQLKQAALRNDINFNGWVEKREINEFRSITITISYHDLDSFRWNELNHFKKLREIRINNKIYRLSDYTNHSDLKTAIKEKKGRSIPKFRYSDHADPELVEPDQPDPITKFPEVEPEFPGGMDTLISWINNNLVHPDNHLNRLYGKVYLSFVVQKDGSIGSIVLIKGLREDYDQEAIKLVEKMPNWLPAYHAGNSVKSRITIPIHFQP